MKIDLKVQSFFDTKKVSNAVDRAKRGALSKIGAFVRRTARTLTRRKATKRRKVSLPGEPPLRHTDILRDGILFAYDKSSDSVVIGPRKLNNNTKAPENLEFGGRTRVGGRVVTIKARPFMGPALKENEAKIPEIFANSVRS